MDSTRRSRSGDLGVVSGQTQVLEQRTTGAGRPSSLALRVHPLIDSEDQRGQQPATRAEEKVSGMHSPCDPRCVGRLVLEGRDETIHQVKTGADAQPTNEVTKRFDWHGPARACVVGLPVYGISQRLISAASPVPAHRVQPCRCVGCLRCAGRRCRIDPLSARAADPGTRRLRTSAAPRPARASRSASRAESPARYNSSPLILQHPASCRRRCLGRGAPGPHPRAFDARGDLAQVSTIEEGKGGRITLRLRLAHARELS